MLILKLPKTECERALKGLALLCASYSGKIALAGSCSLHSTLAAAPDLFVHAAVTVAKKGSFGTLTGKQAQTRANANK